MRGAVLLNWAGMTKVEEDKFNLRMSTRKGGTLR
jgi:hypothetical protein